MCKECKIMGKSLFSRKGLNTDLALKNTGLKITVHSFDGGRLATKMESYNTHLCTKHPAMH
jgi:hypothetical protein